MSQLITTTQHGVDPADRGLRGFVRRHPLVTFLLIFNTFGQAVAFVPVVARKVYGVELDVDLILVIPTFLFLLLPALVLTWFVRGREGLTTLLHAMFRFRIRGWWYLLPLVAMPAVTLGFAALDQGAFTLRMLLTAYVTAYLPALLFQFLSTNWWEESVWTGFFQAPLQDQLGPWRAVLLTTPFFLLEHLFLMFDGTVVQGLLQAGLLLVVIVAVRVLMATLYNRTKSLALAGLVHAGSNASALGLVPQIYGRPGDGGIALLVLGVAAILVTRGRLGWPRTAR